MVKVLEINNLNYSLFQNFSLSFQHNTFYSIVGSNNSGKTTLFKIISGLIMTNNQIVCSRVNLNNNTKYKYIKKIGVVKTVDKKSFLFQKVLDELMYPLYNLNYKYYDAYQRVVYLLKKFSIEYLINKKIRDLDILEKQKLLLVIALLHQPKVLLIDEVLNIFNKQECLNIINILKEIINDENITIINFTTNLEEALETDFILLLDNHQIIKSMKPNELCDNNQLLYDCHLEIPFIVDLSIKLKMYNVIDKNYNNIEEMVNDIWH